MNGSMDRGESRSSQLDQLCIPEGVCLKDDVFAHGCGP